HSPPDDRRVVFPVASASRDHHPAPGRAGAPPPRTSGADRRPPQPPPPGALAARPAPRGGSRGPPGHSPRRSTSRRSRSTSARGGELSLDYTGTAPQTVGFVNAPLASSYSAVLLTVLMLVDPEIPHNEGILRALRVDIPRGTLLNADFPAATTFGNTLAGPHSDAIFRALADAVPDRVSAGWNRMLGMTVAGM